MRFRVPESARVDHSPCYGNGCPGCDGRGWVETEEGREDREAAEDEAADAARKERAIERGR